MAKKVSVYQIDAFTNTPFQGNPAGVAFGDGLTTEEMQNIAKEMNLAETAFISKSDKADYNLRWFTPTTEVELCGHATIASLHFLSEHDLLSSESKICFDTRSGILKCEEKEGRYFMQIPKYSVKEFEGNKNEIFSALDLENFAVGEPTPFILAENGYLYIYLPNLEMLKNINPNYKELLRLSKTGKPFGAIAAFSLETVDEANFAHLRFFAPYYGIDEDPVTGSANGPLLLVLQHLNFIERNTASLGLVFEQGDFIGRRGRVGVNLLHNELFISGNAVTVLKGELIF